MDLAFLDSIVHGMYVGCCLCISQLSSFYCRCASQGGYQVRMCTRLLPGDMRVLIVVRAGERISTDGFFEVYDRWGFLSSCRFLCSPHRCPANKRVLETETLSRGVSDCMHSSLESFDLPAQPLAFCFGRFVGGSTSLVCSWLR